MQFNTSYKVLHFLNRAHGWPSRYGLGILGWLGTLLTTRSLVLAKALFAEFIADEYDTAFRKAARYARRFSRRMDSFNDAFFDFTMGTDFAERQALARIAERSRLQIPETEYL